MLGACQNLVVVDADGCCQFPHLSVREYFEENVFQLQDCQSFVLSVSLKALHFLDNLPLPANLDTDSFLAFAIYHWDDQAEVMGKDLLASHQTRTLLAIFLGSPMSPSETYVQWNRCVRPNESPRSPGAHICKMGLANVLHA